MDTIVFIETNKSGSSREAIKAANNLNFFTVLLTCRKKFLKDRSEFPDVHEMIIT
ncbi:biotin carboxylase, partial [Priestia megaterium]